MVFSAALDRIARRLAYGSPKLTTIRKNALKQWYADQGDKSLRVNFPTLGKDSVVFDVGGHVGQWASEVYCRYSSQVFVFEPIADHVAELNRRFSPNPSIRVEPFGLSGESKTISISCEGVESSAFKTQQASKNIEVQLVDVKSYCDEKLIERIDLMKINIEGGEYELLDRIVDSGLIKRIGILHIQFHDFVPKANQLVETIREKLMHTHECKWTYPFVWECWLEKESGIE